MSSLVSSLKTLGCGNKCCSFAGCLLNVAFNDLCLFERIFQYKMR